MADDIVTTIHRMVAATTAPSERSPLEHAAMEAAAEIERLRILVANMADALEWCGCGDDDPDELVADTERTAAIRALIWEARRG